MSLEPIFMPPSATKQQRPNITVRPDAQQPEPFQPRFEPRKPFQKATLGDDAAGWGGDGFGTNDVIDLINPLHHIPVVGHIYRALTGDKISTEASVIGGAVFGGAIGLAAAGVSAFIAQEVAAPAAKTLADASAAKAQTASAQTRQAAEIAQMAQRPLITPPSTQPPAPQPSAAAEAASEPLLLSPLNLTPPSTKAPEKAAPMPLSPPISLPSSHKTKPEAPALPLSVQEQHKHDAILELFGSGVSSLQGEYQKAQQLGLLRAAQARMTV